MHSRVFSWGNQPSPTDAESRIWLLITRVLWDTRDHVPASDQGCLAPQMRYCPPYIGICHNVSSAVFPGTSHCTSSVYSYGRHGHPTEQTNTNKEHKTTQPTQKQPD